MACINACKDDKILEDLGMARDINLCFEC